MEKNKRKDITKKLQSLVKHRKTPIVVTKKGTKNYSSRNSSSDSIESYCYAGYKN